jgi:uncharacterized protein (DUF1330 family)
MPNLSVKCETLSVNTAMTYLIVTIKEIKDNEAFQDYASKVKPLIERHGGRYLAIVRDPEIRDGQWPFARTVIVGFPSAKDARSWYDSADYREIIPLRKRAIDANIVMVSDLAELPVKGYELPAG